MTKVRSIIKEGFLVEEGKRMKIIHYDTCLAIKENGEEWISAGIPRLKF